MSEVDAIREALSYDPETGIFLWKRRTIWSVSRNSAVAGSLMQAGYLRIKLNGKPFLAHRLAWMHYYGEQPPPMIDHINGDKTDNRISNLRATDYATNAQNRSTRKNKNNTSGALGIWRRDERFCAQIRVPGKRSQRFLGTFLTAEEAHAAYLKAKAELHPGWERKGVEP